MTDLLTSREVLAAVLARHRYLHRNNGDRTGCRGCTWTADAPAQSQRAREQHEAHVADALLTSSVVRDVATLVDDGALVDDVTQAIFAAQGADLEGTARAAIHALATSLTE